MSSDEDELPDRLVPNRVEGDDVSRRRLIHGAAAAGATVGSASTAGCADLLEDEEHTDETTPEDGNGDTADDDADDGTPDDSDEETSEADDGEAAAREGYVFVFNTGDMSVSVIGSRADELLETAYVGATASFPANQYATHEEGIETLWLNVEGGVKGYDLGDLAEVVDLETGSDSNWQEVTPDGEHLVVSARELTHAQYRLDADPDSEEFGEITGEIDRGEAAPCDVTIGPDGEYAYVPDLQGDTLTVIDVPAFEIAAQVEVDPVVEGADAAQPYMDTASWDGEYLALEYLEGDHGTEGIWDISDPTDPEELVRLTEADGIGAGGTTSEFSADGDLLYLFTPDSEDVTVIDVEAREVADRLDVGGETYAGTWDPGLEKLYVPVQTEDEVVVLADGEIREQIEVGSAPYGATARDVRPDSGIIDRLLPTFANMGVPLGGEGTTYCMGDCYCPGDCD